MRTIGELSKITGLPVRTIKYYASSKERGDGSLESDSANLITPCGRRGNANLFDDDELFNLLMIQVLRSAGVCIDDIRSLLNGEGESSRQVLEKQIVALEKKKAEIDRQIKLARLYSASLDHSGQSEEAEDEIIRLMMSDYMKEYLDRISSKLGIPYEKMIEIEQAAGGPSADEVAELFGQLTDDKTPTQPLSGLVSDLTSIYGFDSDAMDSAYEALAALFTAGVSPRSPLVHEQIRRVIPLRWDLYEPSEEAADVLMDLLGIRGGIFPALMELVIGEGVIEFANEAMRSCFRGDCDDE